MTALMWTANLLGWPVIHFSIASGALRLPSECFARDSWLTVPRCWERDGDLYGIGSPSANGNRLPDGAPWLGGFAKKKLLARNPAYVAQFLLETRRAEIAHWCMLACLPIFLFWNPPWARLGDDRLRTRRQPALHLGATLQPRLFSIAWRELAAALWRVHEPSRRQGWVSRGGGAVTWSISSARMTNMTMLAVTMARIRLWTARIRARAESQGRAFIDESELIEIVNPLLPRGSDVRDVLSHVESPDGFLYLLHLDSEEAARLGWRS